MRLALGMVVMFLVGCAPRPAEPPKRAASEQSWYEPAARQLAEIDRQARSLLRRGQLAPAADLVARGQPLSARLLSIPQPTLAAMEAVSDLDDLYGRILLAKRRYGWARLLFQKNVARWKNWLPQTEETARRLKLANSALAECDRRLAE